MNILTFIIFIWITGRRQRSHSSKSAESPECFKFVDGEQDLSHP